MAGTPAVGTAYDQNRRRYFYDHQTAFRICGKQAGASFGDYRDSSGYRGGYPGAFAGGHHRLWHPVDKEEAAEAALRGAGFTVSLTPVIAIGVSDRPGGLAEAMAALRDGGIIVEYMYAFISRRKDTAYVILRVDDNARAAELVQGAGFSVLREADIEG